MASLRVGDVAAAAGGRLAAGDPQAVLRGAAIDSRAVRGGELFIAFAGAHTDGHRFVADAARRGAGGALVQSLDAVEAAENLVLIEVPDTFRALHDVARSVRRRVPRQLVGITGSAGKTTTKELLAAMLASRFRVARNPGNFNNLYGFPLALLNVPDDAEWMVAEMGMSTPGELRQLSLLGRPDVVLFTVVRPAHLEFFDSVRGIAEAKAEILAGLAADGFVVANAGDAEVARIARRWQREGAGRRVVWYAVEGAAGTFGALGTGGAAGEPAMPPLDVVARDLAAGPGGIGSRFLLDASVFGASLAMELPLHGLYNVENCVAAAACALALGVPPADVAAAAAAARPAAGRGVVDTVRGPRGAVTVIDDSYNSNPDALEKALAGAAQLPAKRRLAVLGDMLELGPDGPRFHREGGRAAARLGFGPLAAVGGELARRLAEGAVAGGAAATWFPDAESAAEWLAGEAGDGDVVLVKGSRGVGLDAVVRRLRALGGEA